MTTLLPHDALRSIWVGISISESPDLARLGLLEAHFRLALGEIARAVLVSSGGLIYGGHLSPEGYTAFLAAELQRYGRRDRPLLVCLPWHEHRQLPLSELEERQRDLGLFGRVVYLDPDGAEVDPAAGRGETPEVVDDQELRQRALTGLRRYMRDRQDGRVLIGGQRQAFQGALPGLMEEALLALEAQQPVYLAGGFGGVTVDIARALEVDDGLWLSHEAAVLEEDPRLTAGYTRLQALAQAPDWPGLLNGLSEDENRRLAVTHRPSDIATLVSLGLGRLAEQGNLGTGTS
jgi:hypothetical protein